MGAYSDPSETSSMELFLDCFACNAKRFVIDFLFFSLFLFLVSAFGWTAKTIFKVLSKCSFECVQLQSFKKYLRQTLVFM